MSSRPDLPLVLLVFDLALAIPVFFGPPSSPLVPLFFGTTEAIFLYAAYWGLVVRRGMAVKLFRHQALGMSLVSLGFFIILITIIIEHMNQTNFLIRFDLYSLLVFFWVDASMRASRDLDPLSRDSFRWSKVRYILWGLNFAGMGVLLGFLAFGFINNPPTGLTPTTVQLLLFMPFFVTFASGIVALTIGAIRSKDRNFRRQLQWFALALLFLFGSIGLSILSPNSGIQGVLGPLSFPVVGYCYYRSARALVPLSRIS